jgi:XTP/dITP diphosphohydrolase
MIPSLCKTLVLATGNPHKVRELSELLSTLDVHLTSLADWPATTPVDEDGSTPAENARKKASGYARQLQQWVLADDTALCVDALDGAPGVRSARYAGAHATMAENRAHLLAELAHVPDQQRTARFVCHLAVANPAGEIVVEASGACAGRIRREPTAGSFGFGYDALFEVADVHRTLAELPPEITAAVGHRGRAVRALAAGWRRQAEGWRPAAFSLRPPPAAR